MLIIAMIVDLRLLKELHELFMAAVDIYTFPLGPATDLEFEH